MVLSVLKLENWCGCLLLFGVGVRGICVVILVIFGNFLVLFVIDFGICNELFLFWFDCGIKMVFWFIYCLFV